MLLLRHASAGERLSSPSADRARKLDRVGRADARRLPAALADFTIDRIVTGPHARCVESVVPLARARGLEVECREELAPDASRRDTLALLAELPETALVCTHREVVERLFDGSVTVEKGGAWLLREARSELAPRIVRSSAHECRTEATEAARQRPSQRRLAARARAAQSWGGSPPGSDSPTARPRGPAPACRSRREPRAPR